MMRQRKGTIAKISQPRLSSVFNRTQLFKRIDKSLEYSAMWICGAPGSGKTTLAASYIKFHKLPCIWYQMDGADAEAANFFHYMTLAASKVFGGKPESLPKIAIENLLNLPNFALGYFRELFNQLKKPFVIVLDNYHEVPTDSIVHEIINAGLEQVPDGLNVFILSRTPPPPVMARLLVNKCMMKIQPEELSLTEEESIGIAALSDKWKPCLDSVAKLHWFTEGWTAGLVLMLEYAEPDEATPFSKKGAATEIFFNYFAGEIFNKMEPAVQQLLLKISCMPSFTPGAAAEITGFKNPGRILDEMNRKNYFTLKKIQNGTFYQFHPLFRTFLRKKAEESLEPELLKKLYQKAADLCIEQGQLEDGFHLHTKINNRSAQAKLIREHSASLIAQGRVGLVAGWLHSLPRDLFNSDPWLLYIYGQCTLPFDPKKSRTALTKAYQYFRKENNYPAMALTICAVVDTVITEWGDYKQLDPWIEVLDDILKNHKELLSAEDQAKTEFALFVALMWRQPHHHHLESLVKRMFELLRSDADPILRIMAGNYLLHYMTWKGDMFQARLAISITRELVKTLELTPLVYLTSKMCEAIYEWFSADLQGCLETVGQGLEAAEKNGVHILDNWLMAQEVYARLSLGDPESARPVLRKMKQILSSHRYLDIGHYYFLRSIYYFQVGNNEMALRHVKESLQAAKTLGTPFPEGLNCIMAARIYFKSGNLSKAYKINARARTIGKEMKSSLLEMLSLYNEAHMCRITGKLGQAREFLKLGLQLERESNLVNFPTWHDDYVQDLYEDALRAKIEVDYVQRRIRTRGLNPRASSVVLENWPWRVRIYTIGRFELVVDQMPLAAGGKTQSKPLELMKALIALGAEDVALSRLEDILWPDADGDRAHRALITTLHRLRKLSGHEQTIVLKDSRMSLNKRHCWLDVWALEHLCGRAEQMNRRTGFDIGSVAGLTIKLLDLYKGDFLKDQEELSWAKPMRMKLRSKFRGSLMRIARALINQNEHDDAIGLYLRGLEIDELAEELYRDLMTCYQKMGRIAEGLSIYERCRETLSAVLGTKPSPKTESIRKALLCQIKEPN